jgi:hypothetical protein
MEDGALYTVRKTGEQNHQTKETGETRRRVCELLCFVFVPAWLCPAVLCFDEEMEDKLQILAV